MSSSQIDNTNTSLEPWIALATGLGAGLLFLPFGYFFFGMAVGLFAYAMRLLWKLRKTERWVHQARVSPPPPPSETSDVWSTIGHDVEWMLNRHQKELHRLQAVVDRVRDMAAALTDSVILIHRRGTIDWWNDAAEQLFDFRAADRGHKLTNLIRHPRFIEYFDEGTYKNPLELNMWQLDKRLEYQVHTYGNGERLVVVRDITRLYRLEQMRKDFVANVSHELRTPLTVIKGYLETLEDAGDLEPKWHKCLQQMQQQSKRMTLLIEDLLTLSKLETDENASTSDAVDISKLIESVVHDAKVLGEKQNANFETGGDTGLTLLGNERELRSAFSNLIVNALNYTSDQANILITYELKSHEAIITVTDNGIGIDPKHIPRLTERFYRVDTSRSVVTGGTGLGLAIVKHVLLRHGAELKVHSKLGQGSTFSCHFPISRAQQNPSNNSRVAS